MIDPLVTLKLLDASAASAAARQVVRAGPALHDGLAAEGSLKDARLRALAAAQDSSMVSCACWGDQGSLGAVWCRIVANGFQGGATVMWSNAASAKCGSGATAAVN